MGDPGRHYLYSSPKPAENEARHSSASTADNDAERSSTRFPSRLLGRSILGNSRSPVQSAIGPSSAEFHGTSSPSGRHLARDQTAGGEISREGQLGRWDAASGNVSDAAVALKQLKNIIEDAVFLDEDAYNGVASLSQYTNTIHAQRRRIVELEHELDMAMRAVERAEARAKAEAKRRQEAEQHVQSIESELENNAVVFKMHYNELIAKDEELTKLKAIIATLSGSS